MDSFNPYGTKHFVRKSQVDIANICEPLFNEINLNYFHYAQMFQDGSMFELHSSMNWHDHFYATSYKTQVPLPKKEIKVGSYNLCLWQGTMDEQVVHDARNLHNFDYPLSITVAQKSYFEVFCFGTHLGNHQILNHYFNHLDKLIRFTQEFKDRAILLIKKAKERKFILPKNYQAKELSILANLGKELTIRGYWGEVKITLKELNILKLISKGSTAKQIAKALNRSPRTIEMQINYLKKKLGCERKNELILLAHNNNIY